MGSRPPTPGIDAALADPLKCMCYHAEFGRSESNAEGINRVKNFETLGHRRVEWGRA